MLLCEHVIKYYIFGFVTMKYYLLLYIYKITIKGKYKKN